jgi:hypothetical protein
MVELLAGLIVIIILFPILCWIGYGILIAIGAVVCVVFAPFMFVCERVGSSFSPPRREIKLEDHRSCVYSCGPSCPKHARDAYDRARQWGELCRHWEEQELIYSNYHSGRLKERELRQLLREEERRHEVNYNSAARKI